MPDKKQIIVIGAGDPPKFVRSIPKGNPVILHNDDNMLKAEDFEKVTEIKDKSESIALIPPVAVRVIPSKLRITFKRSFKKTGRNEPCPCGSGKKFKACHYYKAKATEMVDIVNQLYKKTS